jgi:hypothetical protein
MKKRVFSLSPQKEHFIFLINYTGLTTVVEPEVLGS